MLHFITDKLLPLKVHEILFRNQFIITFTILRIVNTTIDRANRSTLRLIMETYTFGTFICNDVVNIHVFRLKILICLNVISV
ncbi:hypothetical protein D3C86_1865940 [compost metagenome]